MKYIINKLNNQGSPWHKNNTYEIIIYTKGQGKFHSENMSVDMKPGMIVIVPPGILHRSTSDDVIERIYIQGEMSGIFCFDETVVMYDNSDNEGIFFAGMIYKNRNSDDDYIRSLISAFSHFLVQNMKMGNDVFRVVKNIIEVMEIKFCDASFNAGELLNLSGYSEDYIRNEFKKITGKTPVEYLTELRIGHACYLINMYKSIMSLNEISEKCGFSDYVYFSRRFKQMMGVSPRKYMAT